MDQMTYQTKPKVYGFTMKDFEYHMKSEVFVTDIQDDYIKTDTSICDTSICINNNWRSRFGGES